MRVPQGTHKHRGKYYPLCDDVSCVQYVHITNKNKIIMNDL